MNAPMAALGLVFWVLLAFSAGWFGSQFMPGEWYRALAKPSWTPPGWVFGPVWSLLYLLMGVAAWLVWREGGLSKNAPALAAFLVQLALNALWSYIYFGRQAIGWALVEILLLDAAIIATLVLFWRRQPAAGILLVPYLLWTGFATVLLAAIWRMNP